MTNQFTGIRIGWAAVKTALWAWAFSGWVAFAPDAKAQATRPAPVDVRAQIAVLKKTAAGTDPAAALEALKGLDQLGAPADADLLPLVRQRLARDKAAIEAAARVVVDLSRVEAAETALSDLRKQALQAIVDFPDTGPKPLAPATQQAARDRVTKLKTVCDALAPVWAAQTAIVEAAAPRDDLRRIWARLAPSNDDAYGAENEEKLAKLVEKATKLDMDGVKALAARPTVGEQAADIPGWPIWFYRSCRQIEAFNKPIQPWMNANEWEVASFVNIYREALGILPLEFDPRLIQQGRRDCKERVEAPILGNKPSQKDAGYVGPTAQDNVNGSAKAKEVSDILFNVAAFHRHLVDRRVVAIGVGKWRDNWAMLLGGGASVRMMSKDERDKVALKGAVLKPEN